MCTHIHTEVIDSVCGKIMVITYILVFSICGVPNMTYFFSIPPLWEYFHEGGHIPPR